MSSAQSSTQSSTQSSRRGRLRIVQPRTLEGWAEWAAEVIDALPDVVEDDDVERWLADRRPRESEPIP